MVAWGWPPPGLQRHRRSIGPPVSWLTVGCSLSGAPGVPPSWVGNWHGASGPRPGGDAAHSLGGLGCPHGRWPGALPHDGGLAGATKAVLTAGSAADAMVLEAMGPGAVEEEAIGEETIGEETIGKEWTWS